MRRNSGFTMIELMVIVAIVGILIAVAAPSFTESMARRSLEGAANELNADLQYTKSQAASANMPISMLTSAHGYIVGRAPADPDVPSLKTITLNSKITLTAPLTVSFDPYRVFANAVAITLAHTQTSAQLQLKVDAMGLIQMCSPGGSFGGYPAC